MKKAAFILIALLIGFGVVAQRRGPRGGGGGGPWRYGGGEGYSPEYETCKTAREIPSHSTGTPSWTNEPGFEKDSFSFVRIRRDRAPNSTYRAGQWWTIFPTAT